MPTLNSAHSTPERSIPPHEKWTVGCVAFAAFTFQFEAFLVGVALPDMAREMGASSTEISFVVMAYLLAATLTFLPAGRMGVRYGLRTVFLFGTLLSCLGTLMSGLSTHLPMLWTSRFIQGVGMGALVAVSYAMIPAWIEQKRLGWGYGMLSFGAGMGMIAGLPVGGILSHYFVWQWIFLATIPIFVLLFAMAYLHLPREKPLQNILPKRSGTHWINLFQHHGFLLALLTLFVFQFVSSGVRFLMPFYLELSMGMTALMSGVFMLIFPLSFAPTGIWAGRLADRMDARSLVLFAFGMGALICALYVGVLEQLNIWFFCVFMLSFGIVCALFTPPNNRLIMMSLPELQRGEASALLPVALNMGSLLGIGFFETIFSMNFPSQAHKALLELASNQATQYAIIEGFTTAFLCASIICFGTFLFLLFNRFRKN